MSVFWTPGAPNRTLPWAWRKRYTKLIHLGIAAIWLSGFGMGSVVTRHEGMWWFWLIINLVCLVLNWTMVSRNIRRVVD